MHRTTASATVLDSYVICGFFFQVLVGLVKVPKEVVPSPNEIVFQFLYKAVFGAIWGVGFGMAEWVWLSLIFNKSKVIASVAIVIAVPIVIAIAMVIAIVFVYSLILSS